MLKYCLECWDKHKDDLTKELRSRTDLNQCDYTDLVKLIVKTVFVEPVGNPEWGNAWDAENITSIDNGDYQGTLLFLIPMDTYQPSESEYLMTYVRYGSCSVCDTLQSIQLGYSNEALEEAQVKDFMALCKDIVTNTIRPYNYGWRTDERFVEVKYENA